jgi:hypothetical protein
MADDDHRNVHPGGTTPPRPDEPVSDPAPTSPPVREPTPTAQPSLLDRIKKALGM